MGSFVAAFARQQLRDMESLQRDLGRERDPVRDRATRRTRWAVLLQSRLTRRR